MVLTVLIEVVVRGLIGHGGPFFRMTISGDIDVVLLAYTGNKENVDGLHPAWKT